MELLIHSETSMMIKLLENKLFTYVHMVFIGYFYRKYLWDISSLVHKNELGKHIVQPYATTIYNYALLVVTTYVPVLMLQLKRINSSRQWRIYASVI